MLITRTSSITGEQHTLDLPVTQEQLDRYAKGGMIQHVFPHLTPGQREFLMTGITDEEWQNHFPEDDEEEYCECGKPLDQCYGCSPNESGFTIHPVTKG